MVYHERLLYENIEMALCDITHDNDENDRFGYTLGSQKLRPLVTDSTDCFVLLDVSLAAALCKQRIHYVFPRCRNSIIVSCATGSNVLKTFFLGKVMISLFLKIVKTKSIPFIPLFPFKDDHFCNQWLGTRQEENELSSFPAVDQIMMISVLFVNQKLTEKPPLKLRMLFQTKNHHLFSFRYWKHVKRRPARRTAQTRLRKPTLLI
ncbi:hypothetical protein METSCH_F04150 [Metschnikowia aff. pulcherrima]|uniref:Uncharacterized protein n=1 Tax=Metschnikowia aff. pulcherrima TaxID=2163413 RepID=A0A4P6XTA3_9ASCO|nr:hypothetical protein METSCH_F04150 [Metschnikowia aff. pulcherrima]